MGRLLVLLPLLLWSCCPASMGALGPPTVPPLAKTIYVVDHGWHTGIVVKRADIDDALWPDNDDFPDATYLEVGWGDQDFYQASASTPGLAFRAAFGSRGSVLYITGLDVPVEATLPTQNIVELALSPSGFAALSTFIHATYKRDPTGQALPVDPPPSRHGRFYLAEGTYSLTNTCNTWTASALAAASVPVTPASTAGGVMCQLQPGKQRWR